MRQGWKLLACVVALGALTAGAPLAATAAKATTATSGSATTSKKSMRQYTGYVTALDKTSITVEKRGKKPESKVFAKHSDMNTVGDLGKDAHVTVYYRDDAGRPTAHKVVVKPAAVSASVKR